MICHTKNYICTNYLANTVTTATIAGMKRQTQPDFNNILTGNETGSKLVIQFDPDPTWG